MAIDIGVNFLHKNFTFGSITFIMEESYKNGITNIISICDKASNAKKNTEITHYNQNLFCTIGHHPIYYKDYNDDQSLQMIEEYIKDKKCIAIGECGLDYFVVDKDIDIEIIKLKQKKIFIDQILLAKKYNKKLYMHCRNAHSDFIEILKEYNYFNGVVHCFTGEVSEAIELTELGLYIGITGWIFDKRRNQPLVETIKHIDLKYLMVETDAPHLAKKPKKQSEPIDILEIIDEIAIIKKMDKNIVKKQIFYNTIECFNLFK